jgi:hypothetical protein
MLQPGLSMHACAHATTVVAFRLPLTRSNTPGVGGEKSMSTVALKGTVSPASSESTESTETATGVAAGVLAGAGVDAATMTGVAAGGAAPTSPMATVVPGGATDPENVPAHKLPATAYEKS